MRGSVIRAAMGRGHTVVGQVRRDTALFALPPPRAPGKHGRSRLYGAKLDAAAVAQLPVSHHPIGGYDGRMARLRHLVCRPRFLRGVIVQAVWCELQKRGGGWAKQRLLLSTDPTLSAVAVVEAYANRWTVEPLLTAKAEPETLALVRPGGWRKAATLTPGLVKDALARRFRDFEAFRLLPTTRGTSGPGRGTGPPERAAAA